MEFYIPPPDENPDKNPPAETQKSMEQILVKFLADLSIPLPPLDTAEQIKRRFIEIGFHPSEHAKENPDMFDTLFFGFKNCLVVRTEPGQPDHVVDHYFVKNKSQQI